MTGEIKKEDMGADKKEEEKENKSLYLEPFVDSTVEQYKRRKKVWRIVLLSIAGLVLLVYIGGVIYNYNYFALDTEINGYDVSLKSIEEVEKQFRKINEAYKLNVIYKNANEQITTGDGKLSVTLDRSIKQIKMEQNPLLWPIHMLYHEEYEAAYVIDFDEEEMKKYIDSFVCMQDVNMREPKDAYVRIQNGEVVVFDDVTGTKLDKNLVYDNVFASLHEMNESVDIDKAGCYIEAKIKTDSEIIQKQAQKAENYLSISGVLIIDKDRIEISPEELCELAYIDFDGKLNISEHCVRAFADEFVKEHNTSYTDRKFKTHDGFTISVYGGYYGWEFDADALETQLYEALCNMEDFEIEVPYFHRGYVYKNGSDIGNSYVEIDLTKQHVYLYVEGQRVHDADCVTGNVSAGHSTPGGLFGLTYKARNTVLIGADYASNVSFWMPFNRGIGLHDASWRSKFGGDIYLTDGSHGCVNLYYSDAEIIYNNVETNFPIVCYWK